MSWRSASSSRSLTLAASLALPCRPAYHAALRTAKRGVRGLNIGVETKIPSQSMKTAAHPSRKTVLRGQAVTDTGAVRVCGVPGILRDRKPTHVCRA